MLTMHAMETSPASSTWTNPFIAWDAALRWNQMAIEWMTKGWQQWLAVATVWPALESGHPTPANTAQAVDLPDPVTPAQARAARAVAGALVSRPRGNDGARAHASDGAKPARAKASTRTAAKPAVKSASSRTAARPQAASRPTARSRRK
jgi:hypothetical protein